MTLALFIAVVIAFITSADAVEKRRYCRQLEAKLKRLSAANDDELMVILEATESPLSTRILEFLKPPEPAKALPPLEPENKVMYTDPVSGGKVIVGSAKPKSRRTLTKAQWEALVVDLRTQSYDPGRVDVLRSWKKSGMRLTPAQYAEVMRFFSYDDGRREARQVLGPPTE